ncbi:hypothetical protein [Neobacillus soli]|uniref:hypothetical protein n=1 Tax=Neobacillus soli TaxID=220688 RepID=UPI0008257C9C|nr:hypothetical protein [Neobacillus soli]
MKAYGKIIIVLMLSVSLIGLSGCFGKDKDSNTAKQQANASTQSTDKAAEKDQSTDQADKTTESTNQTNKTSQSTKPANKASDKTTQKTDTGKKPSKNTNTKPSKNQTAVGEKEITNFILDNTRIVQISNISRRTNEKHPDLGPFFVVRGIDLRGEVSEVWVKDMKIFEMVTQTKK